MSRTMNFEKMVENAQKVGTPGAKKETKNDERFYQIILKDGTTSAVLRFIPNHESDDTFFIQEFTHSFKVDGRKLFTKCPTTIGLECPICEYNKENWDNYSKQEQTDRKRKLKYVSNIYVVADPDNKAREGKVFLWAYGISVHKKIMNMIVPPQNVPKPKKSFNVFDFKNGKDFELNVCLKDGNNNYDQSQFSDEPSALCDGDEAKLNEIEKNTYILKDLLPTKESLKSYDDLKQWLESTLTGKRTNRKSSSDADSDYVKDVSTLENTPLNLKMESEAPKNTKAKVETKSKVSEKEPEVKPTTEDEFFTF